MLLVVSVTPTNEKTDTNETRAVFEVRQKQTSTSICSIITNVIIEKTFDFLNSYCRFIRNRHQNLQIYFEQEIWRAKVVEFSLAILPLASIFIFL